MLICWLEPPAAKIQGDQIYRTRQPCEDLAQSRNLGGDAIYTICGSWLSPSMRVAARKACLLVCAQSVEPDLLAIFAERRAHALPTVFEVNDNFLEPRAFGAVGSFYHHPDQRTLALQLLAAADAAQVSSMTLAEVFGPYARRTEVFANAVHTLGQLTPLPASRHPGTLRLGWAGSAGHDEDLTTIMPALQTLMAKLPQLTLAIMAPPSLRPLFDWLAPERLDYRCDGSFAAYHAFLQSLDIGLAPLNDTPFNRGRSDVKFVEYAAAGACAVVQRAPAYASVRASVTAQTFTNNEELVSTVTALASNPDRMGSLRKAAHAYLQAERTRPQMLARRLTFYSELTRHLSKARTPARTRLLQALAAARPTAPDFTLGHEGASRCVQVSLDTAARHLFNGLLEQQANRAGSEDFARAIRYRPDDYLGHLYLGHHARAPAQGLQAAERALSLAMDSPAAATAVAHQALAAGHYARAWQVWQRATAAQRSYVPLALAAHEAAKRGAARASSPQAEPLWQALSCALNHPMLARALAIWWLCLPAGAVDAPVDARSARKPETSRKNSEQALAAILAALRRAEQAWPQDGQLPLLRSQLLRASGQWEACWQQLRTLCALEGAAGFGWDNATLRGVFALGAEAARKTGRMASARRLAQRATSSAHL